MAPLPVKPSAPPTLGQLPEVGASASFGSVRRTVSSRSIVPAHVPRPLMSISSALLWTMYATENEPPVVEPVHLVAVILSRAVSFELPLTRIDRRPPLFAARCRGVRPVSTSRGR